jgi:hypothetical protein
MVVLSLNRWRADRLHEKAQRHSNSGMGDEALRLYEKALAIDPDRSNTLYNIGLTYKYRRDWAKSLNFNARAYALAPQDEAIRWNYAIAATALRDWKTARRLWAENGIEIEGDTGPIEMNFGQTPLRLNSDEDGEVVWGQRIDPVRARIESVPLPDSGFRYGDVVLHDGAAAGYRLLNGSKRAVFNVFEVFEPSSYGTFVVQIEVSDQSTLDKALAMAKVDDLEVEDWTRNIQILCRKCSEGLPHDEHDQEMPVEWQPEHRLGIAFRDHKSVDELLKRWECHLPISVIESKLALNP